MRIIFFKWGNYDEDVILNTLKKQGHFVSAFDASNQKEPGKPGQFGGNGEEYELESMGGLEADEIVNSLVREASKFHAEVFFSMESPVSLSSFISVKTVLR